MTIDINFLSYQIKAVRIRLEKATMAAHKRQAVTFNIPPDPSASVSRTDLPAQLQKQSSMNSASSSEAGEANTDLPLSSHIKRQSQRTYTRMSRSAHEERLKRSEQTKVRYGLFVQNEVDV
jgi:hypothetical protein